MTFKEKAILTIKQIPRGRVATYGQVAALAGSPRGARMVGQILRQSSAADHLPWQRVINARGEISIVNFDYPSELQAELLRQEGVEVKEVNRVYVVALGRYLWNPIDATTEPDTVNT